MSFKVITPPAIAPVALEDMKAHLRVTSSAENSTIAGCVSVATAEIEAMLGAGLITQTGVLRVAPFGAAPFELPVFPVQSIESIECILSDGSSAQIDPLDFELWDTGEAALLRVKAWPGAIEVRPDAIKITLVVGYGDAAEDIPAPLVHAVKLLAAHRFEHREEILIGATPARIPRGIDALLGLYRRRWFQ